MVSRQLLLRPRRLALLTTPGLILAASVDDEQVGLAVQQRRFGCKLTDSMPERGGAVRVEGEDPVCIAKTQPQQRAPSQHRERQIHHTVRSQRSK